MAAIPEEGETRQGARQVYHGAVVLSVDAAAGGTYSLMAKATNSIGESQPAEKLWNPSGYLLNNVEKTTWS